MSIIDRIKRVLRRTSDGFIERPKAQTMSRYTGRTTKARIGRHSRVRVGLVDLANVCPSCGGYPIETRGGVNFCILSHSWSVDVV